MTASAPTFIRVPLLPVEAICLGDVVLHRHKLCHSLRNHETTHWLQQREVGRKEYARIYWHEYSVARAAGLSRGEAYRKIRFEREAFDHENDGGYNARRKPCAWQDYEEP